MAAQYNGGPPAGSRWAERRAAGRVVVLDGATGTELERLGVDCSLPLWSTRGLLDAPETVAAVHRAYAAAGVDALTAATFRTQARALRSAGLAERAGELCRLAVALARRGAEQAERSCDVLGSAPPLEDCFRPERVPDADALAREHAEHAAHLVGAGVDAVLVETMNCTREAVAAVRAAREAGAPAAVSFVCSGEARLLSGEPLAEALDAVEPLGPFAVGVNCLPPSTVPACLPALRASGLPWLVYANLGAPSGDGTRSEDCTPEAFAEHAAAWRTAGAAAVGGCCGTTPAHLAAVVRRLAGA